MGAWWWLVASATAAAPGSGREDFEPPQPTASSASNASNVAMLRRDGVDLIGAQT